MLCNVSHYCVCVIIYYYVIICVYKCMLLTLNRIEILTFPKVVIPFLLALLVAFPCPSRSLRLGHYRRVSFSYQNLFSAWKPYHKMLPTLLSEALPVHNSFNLLMQAGGMHLLYAEMLMLYLRFWWLFSDVML